MIEWMKIKNLALVENAEVEFGAGFNVISGETGAGKSVIVGALSYLFGKRADKGAIRSGEERCELSAAVALPPGRRPGVAAFLAETGVDSPADALLLRRVITKNSSRNFINDTAVTLAALSSLGDLLVDFHGPHEHQSLLSQATQLELLDRFGGLEGSREACATLHRAVRDAELELQGLKAKLPDGAEAERLRHLVKEIDGAAPLPGEDVAVAEKHGLASNAKQILELASNAKLALHDSEQSVAESLRTIRRGFVELESLNAPQAADFTARVDALIDEARELAIDVDDVASAVELDEQTLSELETRMSTLSTLKRRYGPTLEDALAAAEQAHGKLDTLENFAELEAKLAQGVAAARKRHAAAAAELSAARKKIAADFAVQVGRKLVKLNLPKAVLAAQLSDAPASATGVDRVEFMFSANPGEELQPLRKVASSGEISRVMLAIKTTLGDADAIPVLVFDEIDANIGGETANQVGEELKALGAKHQILCISHLPRVAAHAAWHYSVSKQVEDGRSVARIVALDAPGRVEELARMLGGGKAAEAHAKELIGVTP